MTTKYRSSVELVGSVELAYATLTDYDGLRGWVPGIDHSRVLAREGDIQVVELAFGGRRLVLECIHSPPVEVMFSQVDRFHGRGLVGSWRLSKNGDARLEVQIRADAALLGRRRRRRLRQIVEETLAALRQRVFDQMTGVIPVRTKILEVVQKRDSISIWYRGESYELDREDGP